MKIHRTLYFRGFSLIELILSLTLSSAMLLVILLFYTHTHRVNQEIFLRLQLQADLQSLLQVISKDLRRVGYEGLSESVVQNNFALFAQKATDEVQSVTIARANNELANSCILFFYDLDSNGCLGKYKKDGICRQGEQNNTSDLRNELFGYRLNKKMVETRLMYSNALNNQCQGDDCRRYISPSACSQNSGWTDLLDDTTYEISTLTFTWLAAKKGIEIHLAGNLKQQPDIRYEMKAIAPLLNEIEND